MYDKLGRLSDDCVTSFGGSGVVDSAVKRVSRAYEVRGMVNLISSYDSATVGSGNLVNQVQLDYNEFTQLITEWQAHTSAGVSGSTGNSKGTGVILLMTARRIKIRDATRAQDFRGKEKGS